MVIPGASRGFTESRILLAGRCAGSGLEKSEGTLTSYSSQAQKIVELRANLVFSLDLLPNVVLVVKALNAAGFDGPYLGDTGASIDSTFRVLAGIDYQGSGCSPPEHGRHCRIRG